MNEFDGDWILEVHTKLIVGYWIEACQGEGTKRYSEVRMPKKMKGIQGLGLGH